MLEQIKGPLLDDAMARGGKITTPLKAEAVAKGWWVVDPVGNGILVVPRWRDNQEWFARKTAEMWNEYSQAERVKAARRKVEDGLADDTKALDVAFNLAVADAARIHAEGQHPGPHPVEGDEGVRGCDDA